MSAKTTREVELELDALETELEHALLKIVELLTNPENSPEWSPSEAAWWLCANHRCFVLSRRYTALRDGRYELLIELAARAGSAPDGTRWREWFEKGERVCK